MIIKLAMAVATTAAVLGAVPTQAEPFRIIVTSTEVPLVPNSVLHLAESEGYFERAGVDVELVPAAQTPMAVTALLTGNGEMANISTEALLGLYARQDSSLVAVGSTDKAIPYIIAAHDGVTFDSLSAGTFGVGRENSLDYTLSRQVLSSRGTRIDDMTYLPLGDPAVRAQALQQGRVDATTMSIGVFLAMPERTGLNILVDADTFYRAAPIVTKVNVVSREVLANRRADLEAVLEALTLAARDYAAEPQRWVDAMSRARPDVDPSALAQLAELYADSWTVNGGLQLREATFTGSWYKETGALGGDITIPVGFWTQFEPLDAVLEKLGVSELGDDVTR
ncbi:MAG: ABC transporter substrate-binding protein [Candidatus Devosia phytovorans]|uniref:ABC transporter substrate-binding protein n=1 Tax=Candidatus Devosia phytovorans TaxID=3121372 RepID=A0AAJ5VUS7_9HYPH|nr:ABC transporter substrate-binding protein [Devosia sp.]WEK03769.1 MAG: ABC transporter substrate-binding protein [Devosia sp.]